MPMLEEGRTLVNVEASSVNLPFEFDPDDMGYIENPYPTYRYLREHAPAYFWRKGRAWIVSRYDDVVAILRDPRFSMDFRDWEHAGHRPDNVVFGTGLHHCIGSALARLQGEVAVGTLLERFPAMALAGKPRFLLDPLVRKMASLPVRLG